MSTSSVSPLWDAVHSYPSLSVKGIGERIFTSWFSGLFYNQIWEDPLVDLKALELNPDSRLLTICSGGCNVLTYLLDRPESITAIDLNPYHVYLARLKLTALKRLPHYEDFYSFFGCADREDNLEKYNIYLKHSLDPSTRAYWEGAHFLKGRLFGPRINMFAKNFYNYARLGFFLRFLHSLARIMRVNTKELLQAADYEEQKAFFESKVAPFFENPVVRALGRMPFLLFGLGIPPRQIQELTEESGGQMMDLYRERVRKLACDHPVSDNYFMWQAFGRSYDHENRQGVPEYLKENNYEIIKRGADKIRVEIGGLHDYLRIQADNSLDRFVFLDSQDWMTTKAIIDLWREIARVGRPGSRIIFRTASSLSPVEKVLPQDLRSKFRYERNLSQKCFSVDRSAIYGGFHVYSMAG